MQFGTDAAGNPIVGLRGAQGLSFKLTEDPSHRQYHDYALRYDPIAGEADLFVDGALKIQEYVGFVNSNHPTVGFGDATISDGGHALYELIEWTTCTGVSDGSVC